MNNRNRALIFDLICFTGLAVMSEVVLNQANQLFFSGYAYSITLVLAYIVIVRWGWVGVLLSSLIGLTSVVFMQGATWETFIIYGVGNLFCVIAWLYLKWNRKHHFKFHGSVFALIGQFGVIVGRSLMLIIFGEDPLSALFLVASNEMLSTIAIVMFIVLLSGRKGILVDLAALYDQEEVIS